MSILSRNRYGGRKDRYYMEDPEPVDEFYERDHAMAAAAGPFRTSMTAKSSAVDAHVDWKENSEAHVFKIDLPGVRKNQVKVEVEDGRVISVISEITVEKEDATGMWQRVERSTERFVRRISLPEDANVERVRAEMNNGVLTITVPKHHFKRSCARRTVEVTGF